MFRYILLACTLICLCRTPPAYTQKRTSLLLQDCIEIAIDESIEARKAENAFITSFWEYRSYKISRLPSISLQATPLQYNSSYTQRYDFEQNIDVYRQQNSVYSSFGVSVKQNMGLTGGTISLDTNLDYINNNSTNSYSQFSGVPIRISYSQKLFGFNNFKWDKSLEPLKYKMAEKQYLYAIEEITEQTVAYFFDYAIAQKEYEMSIENMLSADSLYRSGLERNRISAISPADIDILNIDRLNTKNSTLTAEANLIKARRILAMFLGLEPTVLEHAQAELPSDITPVCIHYNNALELAKENNPQELANAQALLQAEMNLERTKKESGFNANLSAGIGFNQIGNNFKDVYSNLSRQSIVSFNLSVPIFDWGDRKGRIKIANVHLESTRSKVEQNSNSIESEIITTINDINSYRTMIIASDEILHLSQSAYNITKQRFLIGKADINTLTLALNRKTEAVRNYLSALKNYWTAYYKIRKLTLYDFDKKQPVCIGFDNIIKRHTYK